ncbi:TetR/AcrR family transcriptional regulator [Staphylospora marina]|uniref:TetR/AcrR family transcriptional regulator n=1 Tax=Staphylospora marina TaxID=2490858 RepID=UPI0013DE03DA|nr:TetR/AcrR family transcriptional regulator [Staphylospora marina]
MARKKVDMRELFDATGQLLLERGYGGFHFGALSERLGVGRSTIYEYFRSKEQLILAYMNDLMGKVLAECEKQGALPPLDRLRNWLSVFMRYSHIQRIFQSLPFLDPTESPEAEAFMRKLFQDHKKLYVMIEQTIEEAKDAGVIRKSVPTGLLTAMIFSSVYLPEVMGPGQSVSGEDFLDLLHRGFEPRGDGD